MIIVSQIKMFYISYLLFFFVSFLLARSRKFLCSSYILRFSIRASIWRLNLTTFVKGLALNLKGSVFLTRPELISLESTGFDCTLSLLISFPLFYFL
ncbi:hypothetical protein GLOIN_2v1692311 [Rhizophagus irregularis DAOM 181602=DAOM 197198]|nr:hypothetical protein GLOIN_2v1692311 [Rhizophagus irregularis DAOM 181602=DAOM 197198]